jgi:glycerophosphoryl diester phosphodiesterase
MQSVKADRPEFVIYGHRGSSARAPENTIASFRALIEDGARAVELDVHRCRSGEIVVAHDDDLSRTAGRDTRIRDTDLGELRKHDVGSWFSAEFSGERVPLMDEVFDLLGAGFRYDIEIKHYGRESPAGLLEEDLARMLNKRGLEDHCIVSSFDPLVVRRFNRTGSRARSALIYGERSKMPFLLRGGRSRVLCGPSVIKPHHREVTGQLIDREHRRGVAVLPWTVDDPERAKELHALGVDGIITNVPGIIAETLSDLLPVREGSRQDPRQAGGQAH